VKASSLPRTGTQFATLRHVADPLQDIFDVPAPELFQSRSLVVRHGALERFPAFMRTGAMENVESLCRSYVGNVEVAKGSALDGIQTPVSGVHPTALLRLGLTVFFPDLRRALPKSNEWLRGLEAALGLPECSSMMAFANSAGSGLSLHHDRYDQLFFQIRGRKLFQYAPNGYVENPDVQFSPCGPAHPDFGRSYRAGFPLTNEELLKKAFETLELEPGSCFFMPSGTWHTTAEQPSDSLSLVVAVRAPSYLDVLLNFVQYYASQTPAWRARPYGAWSRDTEVAAAPQAELSRLASDLSKRLPGLPLSEAFKAWVAHGHVVGIQAEYPSHERFARFIRIPNSSLRFEDDAALGKLRCVVLAGPTNRPPAQTVLGIEHEARPIIDWILASNAAFSVGALCTALPDFEPTEVEELLASLAGAGLIRPLLAPEWGDA
jgi:hypothetical protein